jgi:hypothetical protein
VLDPRISYKGLFADFEDDEALNEYLESSRTDLFTFFNQKYIPSHSTTSCVSSQTSIPARSQSLSSTSFLGKGSPQKVNFRAVYRKTAPTNMNELDRYFSLPQEDIELCDPLAWWYSRRKEFPHLYQLARDILAIPGQRTNSYFFY